MAAMTLDLRIDELVLHGFEAGARHAIAEAVERELETLLAADPAPWPGRETSVLRVDAGAVELPADAPPAAIGTEIARAVHRGLPGAPR